MIFSTKSQDLYNKNILQIADLGIYELSDFSIRVLYFLIRQQMLSGKVFYSHETIASLVGCSVSTIRRSLLTLRSLGLIEWQQRCNKSCLYFVSAILLIKSNLKRIKQFFTTYFRCILPKSLQSPKKSSECDTSKNEQLSKFKGIFNMVISHLSNKVKGVDPEDPFGDRTKEPLVFKKTEQKQEDSNDYALRDAIITTIEKLLPLTDHGKIKLRYYPISALQLAQKEMAIVLKRENPFIYLLRICEEHCKHNSLYVERSKYHQMCHKKGINPKDNNFYDVDAFEQSKITKLVTKNRWRNEENGTLNVRPACYTVWRPENVREKQELPNDLSFMQNVHLENSTAAYFRDILVGKVKVIY